MEIFALKGHKVVVTEKSQQFGNDSDTEKVKKYLEIGKEYTVERTEVGGYHTDVYLVEVPGKIFNSVNFEDVEPQPPHKRGLHEDWKKYNR